MNARRTSTSHVARTAAATAARRRRYLQQQAERVGWLVPEMTDGQLGALAGLIAEELEIRRSVTDLVTAQRDGTPPACAESGCTECVQIRHPRTESRDERVA